MLLQRFSVPFEYPVFFTRDVLDPDNRVLVDALCRREPAGTHRVFVVLDQGVAAAWPELPKRLSAYAAAHADRITLVAPAEIVPGGEDVKNDPALVERLQSRLQELGMDRHAFVVIIGGGAVLDMAGYAAGTTHRGLRVIRIPTTVLAQGDGGVGVKTGVNAYSVKNFLGTFTPPFAVINDRRFLRSLPARDVRAGVAEAVKVAIIRDAAFFESMEQRVAAIRAGEVDVVAEVAHQAARLHLAHIAEGGDPFEFGTSRPLDLGHWSAHKLEMLTQGELRHGEAVAIGMAIDARYAEQSGLIGGDELARIVGLLEGVGLCTWHDALDKVDADGRRAVLAGLEEFREHLGGDLTLVMPAGIGRVTEVHEVDTDRVLGAIEWLKARSH